MQQSSKTGIRLPEHQNSVRPAEFIPIYEPTLGEQEDLLDTIRSGWISSNGRYIREFEQRFAAFAWITV
ncbi:MAG: hypothetical protein R2867_37975 [Caldilineaceae bacterium]